MSDLESWAWPALFLLGAYHGVNPGMGWLFAVALGLQERSRQAVGRSLLPIALGHGLAIGLVVLLAALFEDFLPLHWVKLVVAGILLGFGLYRLVVQRHPRWGGMQVGFPDLTFWSFLMASAHGAGFMLLPVLLGSSAAASSAGGHSSASVGALGGAWTSVAAVLVHTAGYLIVTGLVAWLVYEKLGLALLRKSWVNLDLLWALALLGAGFLVLLV